MISMPSPGTSRQDLFARGGLRLGARRLSEPVPITTLYYKGKCVDGQWLCHFMMVTLSPKKVG